MIPRSRSISSTRRRPNGNRKNNHTAWAMICCGKRWRLSLTGGRVILHRYTTARSVRVNVTSPLIHHPSRVSRRVELHNPTEPPRYEALISGQALSERFPTLTCVGRMSRIPGLKRGREAEAVSLGIPRCAQIEFVKTRWGSCGGNAEWHALGVVE